MVQPTVLDQPDAPNAAAAPLTFEQFRTEWLGDVLAGNPTTVQKGNRFAQKLISQWKDLPEGSIDVVFCDGCGDGGIDVAFLDRGEGRPLASGDSADGEEAHTWYLVQSKYGAAFRGVDTLVSEGRKVVATLAGEQKRLSSLAGDLLQRLTTFRATAGEFDRITLVYATELPLSENEHKALEDVRSIGRNRLGNLFDVEAVSIETIYQQVLEETTAPHHMAVPLRAHVTPSGEDLLVGSVTLVDLYDFLKAYRSQTNDLDRLYEKNVRKFLGSGKKVNKEMRRTLATEPQRFGLYNNGITIVVADFKYTGGGAVDLLDPYIVNGCQTTKTIWEICRQRLDAGGSGSNPELEEWVEKAARGVVVAKIVKVGELGESLLQAITRYTNSQNSVSAKDFIALSEDFRSWAALMARDFGVYLEVQRGGWESRRALQKQNPSLHQFREAANAFDLLKVYGSGWLGEAGLAFGKNAPFLPGGAVFKRVTDPTQEFGTGDLYAAYRLQGAADKFKFGRSAEANSRKQTRFLFYFVLVDLLRNVLLLGGRPHDNKDITKVLLKLFLSDNQLALNELLGVAIAVIDEYMSSDTEESVTKEPSFKSRFNSDLNAFLKQEDLGRSEEATPVLRALLSGHKKVMGRSVRGAPSVRQILNDAVCAP